MTLESWEELEINVLIQNYVKSTTDDNPFKNALINMDNRKKKYIMERLNRPNDTKKQKLRQAIRKTMSKEINGNQSSETNGKNIFSGKLILSAIFIIVCSVLFLYFSKTTSGGETNVLVIGSGNDSKPTANSFEVVPDKMPDNPVANVYRDMFSVTSNKTIVGILGATVFSQVVHQVGISNQTETYKQFNLTLEETKNQITNETAPLLPLPFDDIKMFFKLNFLKEYNQSIFEMEDFLVDGKVDINKIKRLPNTEFTKLNSEINNFLENLPQIDKNLMAELNLGIMKETIKKNWNTESFDINEMMNVVNNYYANKDKFPRNQRIPSKEEIENRLIDAHRRIINKSLFGFGYLTGLGYGTLTREDNIKIDETFQIFSQMENEVRKLELEREANKKKIKEEKTIQEEVTAYEKDKNAIKNELEQKQKNRYKIKKDDSVKKQQIEKRKTGLFSSFKQATGRLL